MSAKNKLLKQFETIGIKTKERLISLGKDGIYKWSKIHLHEIDLVVSGASTVTLYLGDTEVYKRTLTDSGEIHSIDRDLFLQSNDILPLSISVSAAVTVSGNIFYSLETIGGPSKKMEV